MFIHLIYLLATSAARGIIKIVRDLTETKFEHENLDENTRVKLANFTDRVPLINREGRSTL